VTEVDLSVSLGPLKLKNPVITASGTFGSGREYADFLDLSLLGAVTVKGITLEPRPGNPPPRIAETPAGMLNAIGLANPGVEIFINEVLPPLLEEKVPVVANISGNQVEEYALLAEKLSNRGLAALELNVSCPNVEAGGLAFGTSPEMVAAVTGAVKKRTSLPVIVKLSPNVTDISVIAKAAEDAGADALSLINTLVGLEIDLNTRRPLLGNVTGGLSGPAIRPVALACVWKVYRAVKLPLIGMGGITCTEDALKFILAGATAVAVGTGNFINPCTTVEIIKGLENYCRNNGVSGISDLVGEAHRSEGDKYASSR